MNKLIAGSLSGFKSFVREFLKLHQPSFYVLINDSGIYFFSADNKGFYTITNNKIPDSTDVSSIMDKSIEELLRNPHYFGQPLTILIGGSHCFFHIDKVNQSSPLLEPKKLFDWLGSEPVNIRFRYLKTCKSEKYIFYSGIREKLLTEITESFTKAGIIVTDVIPVIYSVLNDWAKKVSLPGTSVDLPGEVVSINHSTGKISVLDSKSDNSPKSYTTALFKNPLFQFTKKKPFWGNVGLSKTLSAILPLNRGLRLSALLLSGITIILMLGWLSLAIAGSYYEKKLSKYQIEYANKTRLENEINELQLSLRESGLSDFGQIQRAAIISMFCQRCPSGLHLTELTASQDINDDWVISVRGISSSEKDVFRYLELLQQLMSGLNPEITHLREEPQTNLRHDQVAEIKYDFVIRVMI